MKKVLILSVVQFGCCSCCCC